MLSRLVSSRNTRRSRAGGDGASQEVAALVPLKTQEELRQKGWTARHEEDRELAGSVDRVDQLYQEYNEAVNDDDTMRKSEVWYRHGRRYTTLEIRGKQQEAEQKANLASTRYPQLCLQYSNEYHLWTRVIELRRLIPDLGEHDKPEISQMQVLQRQLRTFRNEKCQLLNTNLAQFFPELEAASSGASRGSQDTLVGPMHHRGSQETLRSLVKAEFHPLARRAFRAHSLN